MCYRLARILSFAITLLQRESSTLGLPDFPLENLPHVVKILVSLHSYISNSVEIKVDNLWINLATGGNAVDIASGGRGGGMLDIALKKWGEKGGVGGGSGWTCPLERRLVGGNHFFLSCEEYCFLTIADF